MTAYLQVVECSERETDQLILGGAGWDTLAETRREFDRIPGVADSEFILDLIDEAGDIIGDKFVTAITAVSLIGEPLDVLRERARSKP